MLPVPPQCLRARRRRRERQTGDVYKRQVCLFMIRLDGAPKLAMMCNIIAAIITVILGWLFILDVYKRQALGILRPVELPLTVQGPAPFTVFRQHFQGGLQIAERREKGHRGQTPLP